MEKRKAPEMSEHATLLEAKTEEDWLVQLRALLATHGLDVLSTWRDESNKHKHRLVHIAAMRSYPLALKAMAEMGFDLNVQRDSDKCTPLHLAIFFKKSAAIDALKELGVDSTLQNSYGESCDDKYEKLAESKSNIIFLDLEMTSGFYDAGERARILEVAIIITDKDLKELGRGNWAVNGFSADELNGLKEFHQKTFRDAEPGGLFPPLPNSPGNGLFSDVMASETNKDKVSQEIMRLLQKHCMEKSCPIAGNSIQCDREVLMLEMPEVYHFLNHRIIDVSSFTGAMERWLPQSLEAFMADQKHNAEYNHRAVNDVESSIQAMRWIRQHLLTPLPLDTAQQASLTRGEGP